MAPTMIRILDPVATAREVKEGPAPRVAAIGGRSVGMLSNGWRSWDVMLGRLSEIAVEKYEAREVLSRKNPNASSATPKDTMEELVSEVDAAIVGIGH